MSMFQILTQEGWVEVVSGTLMHAPNKFLSILIRVYFLLYHQFVSVVSEQVVTKSSLHIHGDLTYLQDYHGNKTSFIHSVL